MRAADLTWPMATLAAHLGRPSTAGHGAEGVRHDELARWLCAPATPSPSLDDMACVFGLSFDTPGADAGGGLPPHRLRLTLAVLRDAFPTDGEVRRWLRAPDAARGGQRPLDLLLAGRAAELEALAVREWNRRLAPPRDTDAPP